MNENTILQNLRLRLSGIDHLVVAYSGGLDSAVLLHWLSQQSLPHALTAVHVNHGISPLADAWQTHCENQCKRLSVKFSTKKVTVKNTGKGIEAAARSARYAAIASVLAADSLLLTAHHLNDQSETFLLRLFRGSGLKGLAAMRQTQIFPVHNIKVFRPFLNVSRAELEQYAARHQLQWIEDESNIDTRFDRNFLRHKALTLIKQRWPEVEKQISNAAQYLRKADELLEEYGSEDLHRCELKHERLGQSILLEKFARYSRSRQRHIIRVWLASRNLPMPNAEHLEQLFNLIESAEDSQAKLLLDGNEFRRFDGKLYLGESIAEPEQEEYTWNCIDDLNFPNGFSLKNNSADNTASASYKIRWRSVGIRCRPQGRAHSQTLKKLFQEYTIEPWLRSHVPLIYRDEKLVAVGDLWRTSMAEEGELASLIWCYRKEENNNDNGQSK